MEQDKEDALREEIAELNDQLKLLVRTEQRLMRSRAALDRQLERETALSRFAMDASVERDRRRVVEHSMALLKKLFGFERMSAIYLLSTHEPIELISEHAQIKPSEAAISALQQHETSHCWEQELPEVQVVAPLLGLPAFSEGDRLIVVPASTSSREACACLLGWSSAKAQTSYYSDRASKEHLAFFDLLGLHLSHQLERVALMERLERERARLVTSNRELSERMAELKVAHQQLVAVGKLEALGQLAGEVAHDFNNLLAVIVANVEIAREDHPSLELDEVAGTAQRGVALVDQLLRFSRRREVKLLPLDLNVVVNGMKGILQTLVGAGIQLGLSLAPDLDAVVADYGQIEQVLINLVANARDASGGRGRIEISTFSSRGEVRLEVRDQGHGLSREQADQIFEPGFTTKEAGKGSGLGLSIVRGIAERHRGRIEVRSAPGLGARFRVCFPAAESDGACAPVFEELEPPPSSGEVPVLTTHARGD